MKVAEEIKIIMADILSVRTEELKDDTAIGDMATWDSLSHLRIISAIESHFDIRFTPDVLMELEDVADIVKATEARVKA